MPDEREMGHADWVPKANRLGRLTLAGFLIAIGAVVIAVGIILSSGPTPSPAPILPPPDFEVIPRIGPVGAPMIPGQCGQADVGGSLHRIECPH